MESTIHDIPLFETGSPEFEPFADKVAWPARDPAERGQFMPALKAFAIPPGDKVDLSVFYVNPEQPPQPSAQCDRHVDSEELFVALRGNWVIALAAPGDPGSDELPRAGAIKGFVVREGDVFILRAGVWHTGWWPADGDPATFLMVLSGHSTGSDGTAVDYSIRPFQDGAAVFPSTLATLREGAA